MIIREKDKQSLLKIFDSIDYSFEVWAYGSRINGSAHEGSDLDLVIKAKNAKRLPSNIYNEFIKKIKDSNIPILVDIKDFYLLPITFQKNIENKYEVMY